MLSHTWRNIRESRLHNTFLADGADVKHLTARLDVRVISTDHLSLTREIRLRQVVEVQILENQKSTFQRKENPVTIRSLVKKC